MNKYSPFALLALLLAAASAHAARNDRILLILPEEGAMRDEALAYWNDGIGLDVDMVLDPALGAGQPGAQAGMLATFDAITPGADWVMLWVEAPGDLAAQLDELDAGDRRIAAMGPFDAFSDNPADAYVRCHAVILTTPALANDGDRAAFVSQARVVAEQARRSNPGMLLGLALEPAYEEDEVLMPALKLYADTRDFLGIFAVDVGVYEEDGLALVEAIAAAPAPGSRGMYMDMMQRPESVLDPTKEIWMQRAAMVLGVLTILGVVLIVRFKRPPSTTPPSGK